jgi:alpha-ketoglutarate-dependent taurine dioxygenase
MHRMQVTFSNICCANVLAQRLKHLPKRSNFSPSVANKGRLFTTKASLHVPSLEASDLSYAQQLRHVNRVAEQLRQNGILKVSLKFPDPNSEYLERLLFSLHQQHRHQLPITHSAKQGWFWDIRPCTEKFQAGNHQARSETMNEFPWHTDCSYEDPPPRYFALHVLQHDRCGGGTLSIMNVKCLSELLSPVTRSALSRAEYRVSIPPEFVKDPSRRFIVGSLLPANCGSAIMRFREDLLTPLSLKASHALAELNKALKDTGAQPHSTIHLSSEDLPNGSVILVDNRKWLHARNHINDPGRHLRRVRWDAIPFEVASNEQPET